MGALILILFSSSTYFTKGKGDDLKFSMCSCFLWHIEIQNLEINVRFSTPADPL
jgi:hypothetical protein